MMKESIFGIGSDMLTRRDGLLLLQIMALYFLMLLKKPKGALIKTANQNDDNAKETTKVFSTGKSIILILIGLGGLVWGGSIFVKAATVIAAYFGMSDELIALTIMAAGTSLPELATSVVAAIKGKGQMAIGNVIGSNISNILLILGGSALLRPLSIGNITEVDLGAVLVAAIFLLTSAFTFKKNKLDRVEGVMLLLMEAGYMTYLIMKQVS